MRFKSAPFPSEGMHDVTPFRKGVSMQFHRLVPLLALLVLSGFPTIGRCGGGDLELILQPVEPKQGDAILVKAVGEPGRWSRLEGRLLDGTVRFRSGSSLGEWWALAGVPIDGPRRVVLSVEAEAVTGEIRSLRKEIVVAPRRVGQENLRVPRRMVTPPDELRSRIARERRVVERIMARREEPEWFGSFMPPVQAAISSPYGRRRFFNGVARGRHWGVDLRACTGTPVHATQDGVVRLAGDLYYTGGTVIVDHGDGLFSLYAHLSRTDVTEGRRVRRGEVLGAVGATGRVTGAHLHWEMRLGALRLDPFSFCRLSMDPMAD